MRKRRTGTAGRRCLTPPAGQPVPAPAPASGGIDKMRRQFSHAERDTHQGSAQNGPQNGARNLTRLQGYRQEQAAQRHQRAGARKSPSISALVFALASTSPALRKPRTATNRPMEAVNPSLIDCGTERVTTSRRPKRVSRKKRIPDQQAIPGQSASQSLRYRPASHPPAPSRQCPGRR